MNKTRKWTPKKIKLATQCYQLYVSNHPPTEIARSFLISQATFYRYLDFARQKIVKPGFDTIIHAFQDTVRLADIEYRNQPEKSVNRLRALELKLKAIEKLSHCLGFDKTELNGEGGDISVTS